MNNKRFTALEVKPISKGWYLVSLYQYEKLSPDSPDYIKDWVSFDGDNWEYEGYKDYCYVCFIYEKEANKP